eukprot:3766393-Alexandrium_andersonii.AAC.1
MRQAHSLRTVLLAWASERHGLRPIPYTVDPPDWRPAAWAAKLTLHMPGLLRERLRHDKADYLVQLQRDMGEAAARRDQAALYRGARALTR